ncbi:PucR family transcriptional regulator [Nocardioides albidus]|uniref:PucR family transcriptional regulator n=1 Tax=Nocardioides albidus TaxID=1517589 RepID=A0A5C4VN57_9ACTN|nr:PucR family transcriptional regulator [Nocardioides albidus]TNM37302.1 PucR family transcriptional regulator [Nocardioides albidus]
MLPDPSAPPLRATPEFDRLRLAEWFEARLDDLSVAATRAIWQAVPAYRTSGLEEEVTAHCRQVFGVFARTVREGRDPDLADFPETTGHAHKRVEVGVPLADFLKAFRIGQLTMWETLQDYPAEGAERDAVLLTLVSHVMRTVEVGSSAAAAAYHHAQQYRIADLERSQRDTLERLLDGQPLLDQHRTTLAHAGLGGVDAAFVAIVATPGPAARPGFAAHAPGMFVVRHHELVGLVPLDADVPRVAKELAATGLDAVIGVSLPHSGHGAAPDAYREALLAHDTLEGRAGLLAFDAISPLSYLVRRPDPTVRKLVRPEILGFFADDLAADGVYADSLEAYVTHDLNAKEAARALHVHVNTVYYRLERIALKTGADLHRFEDVVELLVAVRAVRAP